MAEENTLYEVWISAPDLSGHQMICRCPSDKIYDVVRGYEKIHTTLSDLKYGIQDLTTDRVLLWWEHGNIEVVNQKTRDRYNYVEVQGGYGLEFIRDR
jgi:trehalose utilization protein|tara:strand:- start:1020 stop:1313 length:294 start_codon:yes stop_codon:yes gene_type:complete